jgi:hypothetical protein
MRTETPRIRQLTFQLGHTPCVLTRRALAAKAAAPSHPRTAGRLRNRVTCIGGVIARKTDLKNANPVFLYSQEQERRFFPGPRCAASAPETR